MILSNPLTALSLLSPVIACLSFYLTTSSLIFAVPSFAQVEPPNQPKTSPGHTSKITVLPLPTYSTTGETVVCLSNDFRITIDQSSLGGSTIPDDLLRAVKGVEKRLWSDKHTYLSPSGGKEFFQNEGPTLANCQHYIDNLILTFSSSENENEGILTSIPSIFDNAILPVEHRPESEAYKLSIPISSPSRISAKTALGLFRGLTTFEQLFYHLPITNAAAEGSSSGSGASIQVIDVGHLPPSEQLPLGSGGAATQQGQGQGQEQGSQTEVGGRRYAPFAPYEVEDKPAFGWRAVLLDTSRNYFSVASILKMLDTMSLVKLNTFHWHITDSNSWPLVLSAYPELSANAAYSQAQVYTEEDIKMLVQYAGERGIDVFIEIDTPGHTATIAPSYPEHVACFEARPFEHFAHQPPPGQLRFADPVVADFTSGIFSAAMPLFQSSYFGTGGDEINVNCMMEDAATTSILNSNSWTLDDALNDFTLRTHATILQAKKTPVVWQEMVLKHGPMPSLNNNTVVSIWVDSRDVRAVLDKGYRIVHAAADYFYLDCGQGEWIGKDGGGNHWCDPFKSWATMYSFNPYANVTEAQKKLVLGGQTSLWAEQTDETNFEQVLWPRAAAIAELFWTGAGESGFPRSSIEAFPRMHDIRYRMVDRGVNAVPLQPHWCALRPGVCVRGA